MGIRNTGSELHDDARVGMSAWESNSTSSISHGHRTSNRGDNGHSDQQNAIQNPDSIDPRHSTSQLFDGQRYRHVPNR